ncbi:hypothetical protein Tco_1112875, partial [Tanacetum coccineum]
MRTRSSGPVVEPSTTPRRRCNKKQSQQVDPTIVEKPVVTMADTRTMAELLQAPTEGYGDAIVIPAILAENFELKHGLLNFVTSKQFCGFEKEDPHARIRWFNKITLTIKHKDVPNSSIKLMLFLFSLEGEDRIWLKKEPSRSIAWEGFKDLLRACPHYGFTELHQIDTFYNSLTSTYQDSLNAAVGGNILTKTLKDALTLIENKSKVRTSQNRPVVAKLSTNTSTSGLSPDIATLTDVVKALLLKNTTPPPVSVNAVEESCVTCGGPHPYYQCLATDGNASGHDVFAKNNNKLENIGVSYDGPPIPPPFSSSPKVVEREPEVTKDPVQPSTEKVQPLDVQPQAPTFEPNFAPKPKLNLPYPSRLNNQKLRERDDHQMMKFLQIFLSLHFNLSFTDALLYMSKFDSAFKNLLSNKEKLFELANTPVNENCSAVILKKLSEKLGDPELTLRVSDEAITFKVGNTSRYSYNDAKSISRIDVIDIACEEYSQEVLGFSYNFECGNPTPTSEPIIAISSPSLTPFEGGDFILEEIKAYLASNSVPPGINDAEFNLEGDIRLIEEMLNKDLYSPLPLKDLKCEELKNVKSSIDEPPELELKDLPSHL